MGKVDLTKEDKAYYTASRYPEVITIGPKSYLSMVGQGDPSSDSYMKHLQALYTVAYGLKFYSKSIKNDFVVPKLESLFWFDEVKYSNMSIEETPLLVPRSEWQWRLLIRMPDCITEHMLNESKETLYQKKKLDLIQKVEWFTHEEGKVVQMLHVGPFANEPESLKQIASFSKDNQLQRGGLHHEIYLSDFRKTAPEKLRTILREPVL